MRAALERLISPHLSTCGACRRPWRFPAQRRTGRRTWRHLDRPRFWGRVGVEAHTTKYGNDGRGIFVLCETCWARLTPEQRLPYYDAITREWLTYWWERDRESFDEYAVARYKVREAVAAGG